MILPRRRRAVLLVIVLASGAALLWYSELRRTQSVPVVPASAVAPARAPLTFDAIVDSTAHMGARFRLDMNTIPGADETRRLQSTIDYLRNVTYAYYDWAMGRDAVSPSAHVINLELLMPAVAAVLEARPEIASGHTGLRSDAVVRLYFLERRMLLTHGVIHASSGPGRFPSLELAPIEKETPLDRTVWGRRIDAMAFSVSDPVILDIVSYAHGGSTGANMVTLGTLVRHHTDREGEFIGSLRGQIRHAHHRTPPPPVDADTMLEGLLYVAFQPYLSLDPEDAVAEFMEVWRETSYIHELGHIFGNQAGLGLANQSGEDEALAYLTELRYGDLPHYTLYNMYKVGVVRGTQPHDAGTKIVYAEFARHIHEAKSRSKGFETIDADTSAGPLTSERINRITYQFPKLGVDEIRSLADLTFEEKYRSRVKDALN